jgi:hypothetical protein
MAASRSVLEALLARVQKRANEPRQSSVVVQSPEARKADGASLEAMSAQTAPPVRDEIADDDIEEYDDELIEIIDDAEVIPQAAAAARAIEPGAFKAGLDRRPNAGAKPAASPAAIPLTAQRARPAPTLEPVRGESVAARPIAATEVAHAQGARRELRNSPFIELLDASLQLGRVAAGGGGAGD